MSGSRWVEVNADHWDAATLNAAHRLMVTATTRPEIIPDAVRIIRDGDMPPSAAQTWDAIVGLEQAGKRVNATTIEEAAGIPAGMWDAIVEQWATTADPKTVLADARLIRVSSARSKAESGLRDAADALARLPEERAAELEDLVGQATMSVHDAVADSQAARTMVRWSDACLEALPGLDPDKPRGMRTGLWLLDSQAGGLYGGELLVVAARPGCGKTAYALQLILNMTDPGTAGMARSGLFVSAEMSPAELAARGMANKECANSMVFRTGTTDKELRWAMEERAKLEERRALTIMRAGGSTTVEDIGARSRRLRDRDELDIVVVDYCQLIGTRDRLQTRDRVSHVSRMLKLLAMDLDIPVVMLSQLNREVGPCDRPDLSHLRESGTLEQDANGVVFLWHEGVNDEQGVKRVAPESESWCRMQTELAKSRSSGLGWGPMDWNRAHQRLRDAAPAMDTAEL